MLLLISIFPVTATAQVDLPEVPLLPETISERDIEMRARYARQWQRDDGTLAIVMQGGFQMTFGPRKLSSAEAVVWIRPAANPEDGRKFYEVTAYLAQQAMVEEAAGTITQDRVLLVSNLRTFGRIIKLSDATSTENIESSLLYQEAERDRAAIEGATGRAIAEISTTSGPVRVAQPDEPKPQRVIRYRLESVEPATTSDGENVIVSRGRVYFSQSGTPDSPMIEIEADRCVIFPAQGAESRFLGDDSASATPTTQPSGTSTQPTTSPSGMPKSPMEQIAGELRAVYLEGDVVLTAGERFVRARKLYYDFENEKALILDAVFRADMPDRGIPLYIRAARIRQLSARQYSADQARLTTSEFYTPHYHIGAEHVNFEDRTPRGVTGAAVDTVAGTYEIKDSTFNIEGMPLAYWPYSKGDFETTESLIRNFRIGYGDNRGFELETQWHLLNMLGLKRPPGFDPTLRLDYFSDRGPGVGIDVDYAGDDNYGLFRSYYIYDDGEDRLGPLRDGKPESKNRGRILWRHRHYLANHWEATIEFSYVSDPNFLEEWRKSEWFEGKDQETALYLKRGEGVEGISLLTNWRTLDFVTQTEHLPDLTYRRIGDTFLDPAVLYHESRIGNVRYRGDDRRFFDDDRLDNKSNSDVTFRNDIRQEAELPLKLGPVNLVPFGSVRGSYWDGQPLDEGGLWRGLGVYGMRGGTMFSRVYDDARSELLDVDRVRHIIKPEFVAWWSHSNTRSELITPFDYGVETIDDFYGFSAALKQTWQTKRGVGDKRRTVDWITFNIETGLFGNVNGREDESNGYVNPLRPENSRSRNYIAADFMYRVSDTTSLLYDFNFDLNDRSFDRHNVSIAVERNPRTSYFVGARYAGDIHMSLVGGGFNYKLNEKYITSARVWLDVDSGDLGETSFAIIRKYPRWYSALSFEYSNLDDDFSISLSVWPEGVPEWAIGTKRYTTLSQTTGIRP
ncbi:MAG: LPS-assembly protein LptD [Phycisphaerales bacterium]|nr:LPS-assembly protein LptD [Phycisphaerales bacterium]